MHMVVRFFCFVSSLFLTAPFVFPQMGPGQFKPQDIDAILNSMTEEDFNNILNELSKLSPQELEELEKIGRQVLLDSGIDPDTGKPLEQKAAPVDTAKPTELPTPNTIIEPKVVVKVQNPVNVQSILDTIIKQINILRQKAHGNEQIARRLAQWADTLNDLIFYVKVVNKKVHHERLATQEFAPLFKDLETLSRELLTYQPHIVVTEKSVDNNDPYKILGISYDATAQEITARYTHLKKKHNPKKIVKQLKEQHASEKEINRERRAAELTLSLIQDAYEQLNDQKTKKIVDDKRLSQPTDQLSPAAQHNLTKVLEAISTSVYQRKLLDQLQEFLKKYEPEQLAQKQLFQAAQTERNKEQLELAKLQPKLTPAKYDKTDYPQQLRTEPTYDYGERRSYPSMPTPTAPTARPGVPLAPIKGYSDEKTYPGNAGGATGSSARQPKAEQEDKQTQEIVKALEEQNKEKKKKEAEKKQKDLQDEVEKLKSQQENLKQPVDAPETASAQVKKPLRAPVSDRELIDNVRSSLVQLKKEMRKDSSRKLFKQMHSQGGTYPPLPVSDLTSIMQQLPLQQLTAALDALYDQLPEERKAQRIVKREWETLTQEYSDTLSCLSRQVKEEEKKYTQAQPQQETPQELQELLSLIKTVCVSFNNLSQELLEKTTLSSTVECDEFLPKGRAEER